MRFLRRHPNRPMGCMEVGRLVQRFIDGALDVERGRRLALHLEDCRRCGIEVDIYEQIKASLAARSTVSLPDDTFERLTHFAQILTHADGRGPQL